MGRHQCITCMVFVLCLGSIPKGVRDMNVLRGKQGIAYEVREEPRASAGLQSQHSGGRNKFKASLVYISENQPSQGYTVRLCLKPQPSNPATMWL